MIPEFNKNYGKWFINDVIRAIQRYEMILPGEPICVALSGGKDSTTLLYILKYLQLFSHLDFKLSAIHIKTFSEYDSAVLKNYCHNLEVPYYEEKLVLEKEEMKKSVCYMCARLKRGAISKLVSENNITKVAYGHHAGDVAETFLMNIFENKKLGSFSPKVEVPESPTVLIRPMVYMEESIIQKLHTKHNLPLLEEPCKYGECNIRSDYKNLIKSMEGMLNKQNLSSIITSSLENLDETNLWKKK